MPPAIKYRDLDRKIRPRLSLLVTLVFLVGLAASFLPANNAEGILMDGGGSTSGYPVGFEDSKECVIKAGGWKFEGGLGIPNLPGAPDPTEGPTQFIIWLFVFALGAVGALSFLMLVWAGVQYMAAVGNPTAQGAAKERMTSVILGILLLLASYVILYTINPNLVDLKEPTLPTMPKEGVDLITKAADRDCGLGSALPLPPDIEHHGIGNTCSDGIDNDSDGDIDGADQGCFGIEFACANGIDDDVDGFTDGTDPDCMILENKIGDPSCSDGIDNDSDGDIDGADQGCFGTELVCANGIDDDVDGFTDRTDPDCRP